MFIVRKKSNFPSMDTKPSKPLPTILYAYGGFGKSTEPGFDPSTLIFMNNFNGVYAIANIRGGGEYGEQWHLAAVKEHRQVSFDDFIGAAEYLT